jgi:hypothetical protein
MKTSNELKKYTQRHVEFFLADNKDSIKEAFEASKENESITIIDYLEDLLSILLNSVLIVIIITMLVIMLATMIILTIKSNL